MATNPILVRLLSGIVEAKKASELDLNLYSPKVYASLSIAKADGAKALEQLTLEYGHEIDSRAATILTKGGAANQAAFVATAQAIAGSAVLSISALASYTRMAIDVEPTIGREREFAGTQLGHLLRSIYAIGHESGSSFLKPPDLQGGVFIVRTFDDLVLGIRDLLLPQMGPVLNRDYIQTEIHSQALANGFKESVVPVIVTDASDGEIEFFSSGLFGGVGIVIDLPKDVEEIDKKYVVEVFDMLKAARKHANE